MPVTAAFEHHNVVSLDDRHDVVITLEPVITARVHPADVMAAVGRATLVSHDADQLIVASVET